MSNWPTLKREPVQLPVFPGLDELLWLTLIEVGGVRRGEWTLIGGQMVLLHAIEHGIQPPRVSTDLDALVNARVAADSVRRFVRELESRGFELTGTSPEGLAHRYDRDGVSIDVLAPEGLGQRSDLTTTPPGRTLQVPGGTQALKRTEFVPVQILDSTGLVPRPSLLGAIICKAEAVDADDMPEAQRTDLALLLSMVDQPLMLANELTPKDRTRIRRRAEMSDPDQLAWRALDAEGASRGRAAYRLLSR
ncbi:hypothetical protein [Candidatus Poriferisocius sp.]|uniref:hypothetical protein n=1 Tax=Candidatus Poriferisocius sp. TaxID=3101276 RepID=UPI003B021EB4